jgi:hypothetical protein
MSTRKQISKADWQERLQTFTSGNRGRIAAIAAGGMTTDIFFMIIVIF